MTFPKGEMVQDIESKRTYWVLKSHPLNLQSVSRWHVVKGADPSRYRVVPRLEISDSDMITFIHIPRCGGTAFTGILAEEYMVWRVGEEIIPSLRNLDEGGVLKKVECLAGHLPYGIHLFISHRCHYLTILRDPVERVVSTYYFFKNRDGWDRKKQPLKQLADSMDLVDFARQSLAKLDNAMVRHVAGMPLEGDIIDPVNENDLGVALTHLGKFRFVGFLDTLKEDIQELAQELEWSAIPKFRISNASNRPKEIDPEIRRELAEINRWDVELYRYAWERFGEV